MRIELEDNLNNNLIRFFKEFNHLSIIMLLYHILIIMSSNFLVKTETFYVYSIFQEVIKYSKYITYFHYIFFMLFFNIFY